MYDLRQDINAKKRIADIGCWIVYSNMIQCAFDKGADMMLYAYGFLAEYDNGY